MASLPNEHRRNPSLFRSISTSYLPFWQNYEPAPGRSEPVFRVQVEQVFGVALLSFRFFTAVFSSPGRPSSAWANSPRAPPGTPGVLFLRQIQELLSHRCPHDDLIPAFGLLPTFGQAGRPHRKVAELGGQIGAVPAGSPDRSRHLVEGNIDRPFFV